MVVENRPGGGSTIGTKFVAGAEPDGYTLLFGLSGSLAVAPALYSSAIDPRKAFVPIATVALLPHVFVENLNVPAKNLARVRRRLCESQSGQAQFRGRTGTPPHLLTTLFKTDAHIDVVLFPYNGSAQSVTDLLGGRTQFTIDGLVTLYPLIKAGKVRPLGIARAERWPALPTCRQWSKAAIRISLSMHGPASSLRPVRRKQLSSSSMQRSMPV